MSSNSTMSSRKIKDAQWRKIYSFLRAHPNTNANNQAKTRCFVEGVYWCLRTGAQWRDLPERYGKWNSVYKRFARWEENGIWEALHVHCADDPDMENAIFDSTVIRAHMCAAGGSKKTVSRMNKPWGVVEVGSVQRYISSLMP